MIDRRTVIAAGAVLAASRVTATPPSLRLPLWPGSPPGGGGPSGPERASATGALTNIAVPSLEIVAPARPNGAAVLVAAGGGYKRIELGKEAYPAAAWLAAHGITAFVLRYRLPPEGWQAGAAAPLQDAQRALRLIRANASRYRIDPARVGVLGFSAGGHLMGLAAVRSHLASYRAIDQVDAQSAKPRSAALIYPVVTLEPPYDRTSTRRSLIGNDPTAAAAATWSVQTHVRAGAPPMFLVQAADDPISNPANTLMLAEACRAAAVPVDLHRLPTGGHGFGMGRPASVTGDWPAWYADWFAKVN